MLLDSLHILSSVILLLLQEAHSCVASMTAYARQIFRIVGGGVHTGSTRHVGHWMAYCTYIGWLWWCRIWWNEDWQGKPKYSEKTCPSVTLFTTNPHDQTRARTRAAAVGSQRLTAWAMARPVLAKKHTHIIVRFCVFTDDNSTSKSCLKHVLCAVIARVARHWLNANPWCSVCKIKTVNLVQVLNKLEKGSKYIYLHVLSSVLLLWYDIWRPHIVSPCSIVPRWIMVMWLICSIIVLKHTQQTVAALTFCVQQTSVVLNFSFTPDNRFSPGLGE
jgi:hypothetical protein